MKTFTLGRLLITVWWWTDKRKGAKGQQGIGFIFEIITPKG